MEATSVVWSAESELDRQPGASRAPASACDSLEA